MTPASGQLHIFDDAVALAKGAAAWITERASQHKGRFVFALSGGNSPKPVYEALAASPFVERFPWDRTDFVLGDERFVKRSDPANNWNMIDQAMFSRVRVPSENLHPIQTEGVTLDEASRHYEIVLQEIYGTGQLDPDRPLLDLSLLGLGDDGHTASLIPGQPVLEVTDRWVAAVTQGRAEQRITLTYPALQSSRAIAFLVTGEGKRDIVDAILCDRSNAPAARLRPSGEVHWFMDRAAAGSRG